MAAFQGAAQTEEDALVAATAKTLIQLVAAANHRVKLLSWGVYFDGVSATAEPVQVELQRQTTAGTSSALTPVKRDDSLSETLQTAARQDFTAEPTKGDTLESKEIHPQGGYEKVYPFGQEPIIGGGGRLGIECTAPANVNARVEMIFEE